MLQIIYILTVLVNGIENGADNLNESFLLGKNLIKGAILYSIISLVVMVTFNVIAVLVFNSMGWG